MATRSSRDDIVIDCIMVDVSGVVHEELNLWLLLGAANCFVGAGGWCECLDPLDIVLIPLHVEKI